MKPTCSVLTTRLRIERIDDRTKQTKLPKIDEVFARSTNLDGNLSRIMVDKMTFSDYPGARLDGATALSAFLMNSRNVSEVKQSGSLGAVIELLKRCDIEQNPKSDHVVNLVDSLFKLTIDGGEDKDCLQRLLTNPHGPLVVLRACKFCSGKLQLIAMNILISLSKLEDSIKILINNNVLNILMTPEMLFRSSTKITVRQSVSSLVNKIASYYPELFPVQQYIDLSFDSNGHRRIDGHMEIQFLHGFINHLTWLNDNKSTLKDPFILFKYFIDEIKSETFESLDHMLLIVKSIVLVSKDANQVDFMIANGLGCALQYLVSTDFLLFRKKRSKTIESNSKERSKLEIMKNTKYKRLSIQDPGDRPSKTLMALSLVKPEKDILNNNDEVNFIACKSAINLFENITDQRLYMITDIISSGLIPSLIFRVGHGSDKDPRFNKIVVTFMYNLLTKIVFNQSDQQSFQIPIALVGVSNEAKANVAPKVILPNSKDFGFSSSNITVQMTDIRSATNTIHSVGVTDLFFSSLFSDDIETIRISLTCLGIMTFSVIQKSVFVYENLAKIFHLCSSRNDMFFPSLSIITEVIMHNDTSDDTLAKILLEMSAIKVLIKALQLSGWIIVIKKVVYKSISKLSIHPSFRQKIYESSGMNTVVMEIIGRKKMIKKLKQDKNMNDDDNDLDFIDNMAVVLKNDIAACKIQKKMRKIFKQLKEKRKEEEEENLESHNKIRRK
jgi:hypothetical protein